MNDLILKYFNKVYVIDNRRLYLRVEYKQDYPLYVFGYIGEIMGINTNDVKKILLPKLINEVDIHNFSPQVLKSKYHPSESWRENIGGLCKELNGNFIVDGVVSNETLIEIMRRKYGYELGLTIYNPMDFTAIQRWVRIEEIWDEYRKKYNKNKRENSI